MSLLDITDYFRRKNKYNVSITVFPGEIIFAQLSLIVEYKDIYLKK